MTTPDSIAIVGMGMRLPGGANNPSSFWNLLTQGVDAITEVPPQRWSSHAFFSSDPACPGTSISRWGGFIPDLDRFDPEFFGISPREAARMDPQQRVLL